MPLVEAIETVLALRGRLESENQEDQNGRYITRVSKLIKMWIEVTGKQNGIRPVIYFEDEFWEFWKNWREDSL